MFIFIQIHIRQELKCWDWNVGPEPRVKLPERSAVLEDWSWNCNWDARRIWKGDMNDSIVFPMRGLAAYEQARHHRAYAPRWLLVDIKVILFFFFFLPAVEGAAEGPEEEPSTAV